MAQDGEGWQGCTSAPHVWFGSIIPLRSDLTLAQLQVTRDHGLLCR